VRRRRRRRRRRRTGYRTKNKNPTQRCGEQVTRIELMEKEFRQLAVEMISRRGEKNAAALSRDEKSSAS